VKRKIIFVNNNLKSGGVARSLVNLLKEINKDYEITLLLFSKVGELVHEIPSNVKVIESNSLFKYLAISNTESKSKISDFIIRAILASITKVFGTAISFKLILLSQRVIGDYDYAISFLQGAGKKVFYGGCNELVLKKINAKTKIGFIHADFLSGDINTTNNRKNYKLFDKIVTVSEGCKANFLAVLPELEGKVYVVRNCSDWIDIQIKGGIDPVQYDSSYFNIVTVARLSPEKGIDRAIESIYKLVNEGYRVKYHIIGDGIEKKRLEGLISDYHLFDFVSFYGDQFNPYRFMKNADLFLLPSFHEAAPMVFDEAKILNLPVLTTETTSTSEMIMSVNAGWVCNNSVNGIKSSLRYILENIDEVKKVKANLARKNYSNKTSIAQLDVVLKSES
jgi:glycosyltransferase involved in cell wall biosynthesis